MKIILVFLCFIVTGISPTELVAEQGKFDDETCQHQLVLFTNALSNREFWALEIFDSWAKIGSGYISGNVRDIGNFDQCVKFRHDTQSYGTIQGQHCHVGVRPMPNSTLSNDSEGFDLREFASFLRMTGQRVFNGFCLPASCSSKMALDYLNDEFLNKNDLEGVSIECRTGDPFDFTTTDYVAIVIYGIVLLALTSNTLYDLYMRSKNKVPHKFWSSYSVYTNGMKLFDVTKIKSSNAINCMNGLRALSIFWIMVGHRVDIQEPFANQKDFEEFMNSPRSTIIITHPIAVDTFFVLGALLMTWATLRDCEKKELSIGRMIWRRYLRYTPAFASLILFVVSLAKFFLTGPVATAELVTSACIRHWWTALLYVQNFLHYKNICLRWTWYLSVDFQLFVISPFIIYLVHKYGKKLLALPAILLATTIIYILSISAALGIPMPSPNRTEDNLNFIYYPTQSRAGPWFIGMLFGYFMYHNRGKTFRINKLLNATLWILTFSVQITILLLTYYFSATKIDSQAAHSSFLALYRNLWAVCICWIIFACQHLKTGGIVRWFLSLPHWQPIARMGLSMYIIHPVFMYVSLLNQRVPVYMNFWQFIPLYLSDIMITIVLSTISYLAFEAPTLILEDYFYKKYKNRHLTVNK